jgi:hypothetical protein
MSNSIAENATIILRTLADQQRPEGGDAWMTGSTIQDVIGLSPEEINDAITILVESGLADWMQTMGSGPFIFSNAWITPRGRFELEKAQTLNQGVETTQMESIRSPIPIGSPYGFTDHDWEIVSDRKARTDILYVVFGFQFQSIHYQTESIKANIRSSFEDAVERYNQIPSSFPIELEFHPLAAGYGEHLFNEIARDIISSDVAVFETSDRNPNVMIELGVALTWGVRVLPIKSEGTERPPSDISGQTWADYRNNASTFLDPDHDQKLLRLVERAARKKART